MLKRKSSCGKLQKAYRPRRIRYSIYCPIPAGYIIPDLGGYPFLAWGEVPHANLARWGRGTPSWPDQMGGVPRPWLGDTPSWPGQIGEVPHPWLGDTPSMASRWYPIPGQEYHVSGYGVTCNGGTPIWDQHTPWEGTWDQWLGTPQEGI